MCLENIVTAGSNYLRLTQPFTFPFSGVSGNASRNVLQDTVSDTEHTEEVDILGIFAVVKCTIRNWTFIPLISMNVEILQFVYKISLCWCNTINTYISTM